MSSQDGHHRSTGNAIASSRSVRRGYPLSHREEQVARLVAQGLSNKAMAAELGIGEQTVKNHMTTIFVKTGLANRTKVALLFYKKFGDDGLQLRFPLPTEI
jgi:DNA-binding NarL/FixJ family response regulator